MRRTSDNSNSTPPPEQFFTTQLEGTYQNNNGQNTKYTDSIPVICVIPELICPPNASPMLSLLYGVWRYSTVCCQPVHLLCKHSGNNTFPQISVDAM